jgi:NAD-dependent SIR2 family protein deacetylase
MIQYHNYAALCLKHSQAVLLTAGAGIGADSGMPTFRGNEGLWKAYPYFKEVGMSF